MDIIDAAEIACGFIFGVLIIKYMTKFIKRKKK